MPGAACGEYTLSESALVLEGESGAGEGEEGVPCQWGAMVLGRNRQSHCGCKRQRAFECKSRGRRGARPGKQQHICPKDYEVMVRGEHIQNKYKLRFALLPTGPE